MDDVMTLTKAKDDFLQIRIRDEVKRELAILAELHGLSMSALVNSLIVKAIREEKGISPKEFEQGAPLARKSKRTLPKKKDTNGHSS